MSNDNRHNERNPKQSAVSKMILPLNFTYATVARFEKAKKKKHVVIMTLETSAAFERETAINNIEIIADKRHNGAAYPHIKAKNEADNVDSE